MSMKAKNIKVIFDIHVGISSIVMKTTQLLFVFLLSNSVYAKNQPLAHTNNQTNDSLSIKAKTLKQLYKLATSSPQGTSNIYKQQFFDAFPNTFQQFNALYGNNLDAHHRPTPLYYQAEDHLLNLFNQLSGIINDTLYYKKIISIAIDGKWDAAYALRKEFESDMQTIIMDGQLRFEYDFPSIWLEQD